MRCLDDCYAASLCETTFCRKGEVEPRVHQDAVEFFLTAFQLILGEGTYLTERHLADALHLFHGGISRVYADEVEDAPEDMRVPQGFVRIFSGTEILEWAEIGMGIGEFIQTGL